MGFDDVCIDSRTAGDGFLFAALQGANTDGHKFVEKAFELGACAALVDAKKVKTFALVDIAKKYNATLIAVDNTLRGLQDLAAFYLQKFPSMLRVGITGSCGKTTAKEIAASIFRCVYGNNNVVCNAGNLNSETGLPLSVFKVRAEHKVGIFELGMNRMGEIAELAKVLKPQIACITNTGCAHIGCIGSREKIALEKKSIFAEFTGNEIAIVPSPSHDEIGAEFTKLLGENINGKTQYFGGDIFYNAGGVKTDNGLAGTELSIPFISKDGTKTEITANFVLPGDHNFKNVLAAIEIAKAANVSADAISKGVSSVKAMFGRCEVMNVKLISDLHKEGINCTVLRDCYNSNPEALSEAIKLCDNIESGATKMHGKKIYVIGSMLELGDDSKSEHRVAGELLENSDADFIFLYGEETDETKKMLHKKEYFYTSDIEKLKSRFYEKISDGDLILLKGSRSCALERLLEGKVTSCF
ncbi:UDP-N-acetylmuramoyl-tripeptide--D-alanyl-D-alanine ligase [Spirochaetia bacterium]|nr:UDP-N-acetylmuramoyl-tripeptide--D-alanyl-D-alanine ligase [Spirochaetia bacterium]